MAAVQETEDLRKAPAASVVAPRPAPGTGGPKLLDRLREALRARHYGRRTEQSHSDRWALRHRRRIVIPIRIKRHDNAHAAQLALSKGLSPPSPPCTIECYTDWKSRLGVI